MTELQVKEAIIESLVEDEALENFLEFTDDDSSYEIVNHYQSMKEDN